MQTTNKMYKVDMVIFIPKFTWLPPSQSPLRQAPRLPPVLLVVTHYSCLSHVERSPRALALDPPDHLSPFTSRSTRVALRDLRGASIMPLTMSSPEPRTIFLRALTEPQSTKPSRRWQPPRVISTTGLQHEHLVPLDAISQSNTLGITLTHNRIALLQAQVS
jgi:hypothetical protein